MNNEPKRDGIGEPEPVDPATIESRITNAIVAVTIVLGGAVAFAALTTPTRVRGATRSSRLCWEERQQQIQQALQAQEDRENVDTKLVHPVVLTKQQ